jgi:soluble lytic murein transglycosylase-like protein
MDWKSANDGPKWVPFINLVESSLAIPPDLLARMAFQESSFLPARIDGTQPSPAGALGILQLMPQFFVEVRAPIPFSESSVQSQIRRAGQYLVSLHARFGDWAEALAAYNFGPGNEDKYLQHKIAGLPAETTNYVTEILADVPMAAPTSGGSA